MSTRSEQANRQLFLFLFAVLLLAVVAAAGNAWLFHAPAQSNRTIETTVRFSDVEVIASRMAMTQEETLRFLREHGVTSIGVPEYTLWRLRRDAGCYVLNTLELAGELALNPELQPYRQFLEQAVAGYGLRFGDYIVLMPAGPWADQVWEHLQELYLVEDARVFRLYKDVYNDMALYTIKGARYDLLPHLGLGAAPEQLAQVEAAGLLINPYLPRRKIEAPATFEMLLATYDGYPLSAVVFEGGSLPAAQHLPALAGALNKRELPAVVYEYHRFPEGMKGLAPLIDYRLAVMLPGSGAALTPEQVLNGIQERKVRILELQLRNLYPNLGGPPLKERLAGYLQGFSSALAAAGYRAGPFAVMSPPPFAAVSYLLMAAGCISLLLLLLRVFMKLRPVAAYTLFFVGTAAAALAFHLSFIHAQQLFSLLAALLFPFYAALIFFLLPLAQQRGAQQAPALSLSPADVVKTLELRSGLRSSLLRLTGAFLFSLAGGLVVHGLLTTPPFFSGLELFRGVKIMYLIPLALAGMTAITLHGLPGEAVVGEQAGKLSSISLSLSQQRSKGFLSVCYRRLRRPLTLCDLLLLGVLLLLVYYYLTRTGHVTEISTMENIFRLSLDRFLGVRPRFKELLIGYPLAMLGLYLLGNTVISGSRNRFVQAVPAILLAVATLAPISVVNTFAHITAPPGLSLLRSVHAFWIGYICGFVYLVIWAKCIFIYLSYRLFRQLRAQQKESGRG